MVQPNVMRIFGAVRSDDRSVSTVAWPAIAGPYGSSSFSARVDGSINDLYLRSIIDGTVVGTAPLEVGTIDTVTPVHAVAILDFPCVAESRGGGSFRYGPID
jgi:hypothetical protein